MLSSSEELYLITSSDIRLLNQFKEENSLFHFRKSHKDQTSTRKCNPSFEPPSHYPKIILKRHGSNIKPLREKVPCILPGAQVRNEASKVIQLGLATKKLIDLNPLPSQVLRGVI